MANTFKAIRPLDHRQEWRLAANRLVRACHSSADVLTMLRGVEGWKEMFPFVERRLPFAWKPWQREWVWRELEKHDAEQAAATQPTADTDEPLETARKIVLG